MGSLVKSRRFRRHHLWRGMAPSRMQPVEGPGGTTQSRNCNDTQRSPMAHAFCVTLP